MEQEEMDNYKHLLVGNILHLTLTKKWFDEIASGEKIEEYRDLKEYWLKRLVDQVNRPNFLLHRPMWKNTYEVEFKHFDRIVFKNGYASDAPVMVVDCKGIKIDRNPFGEWCFVISLGDILYNSKNN